MRAEDQMIGTRKWHATRASVAVRFGRMDSSEAKRRLAEATLDNGAHREAAGGRASGGGQQDDCRAVFVATPAPLGCPSADKMGLRLSAGTLGSLGRSTSPKPPGLRSHICPPPRVRQYRMSGARLLR